MRAHAEVREDGVMRARGKRRECSAGRQVAALHAMHKPCPCPTFKKGQLPNCQSVCLSVKRPSCESTTMSVSCQVGLGGEERRREEEEEAECSLFCFSFNKYLIIFLYLLSIFILIIIIFAFLLILYI